MTLPETGSLDMDNREALAHDDADPLGNALARNGALEQRLDRLTAATFILNARLSDIETRVGAVSPPIDEGFWITPKEACHLTGRSRSCMHKWTRRGKVVARKLGGRIFIDRRSLPVVQKET